MPLPVEFAAASRLAWRMALRSARAARRSADVEDVAEALSEPDTALSPWADAPALLVLLTWAFTSARVFAETPPEPETAAAPLGVPPPCAGAATLAPERVSTSLLTSARVAGMAPASAGRCTVGPPWAGVGLDVVCAEAKPAVAIMAASRIDWLVLFIMFLSLIVEGANLVRDRCFMSGPHSTKLGVRRRARYR